LIFNKYKKAKKPINLAVEHVIVWHWAHFHGLLHLLVEERGVPWVNHRPIANHGQTFSNNVKDVLMNYIE
jgi:hypothetical protein